MKYWRRKEYSVKRIAGKDSRTGSRRRGTTAKSDVAAEVSAILHKLVGVPDHEESEVQEELAEDEIMEIAAEDQMTSDTDPEEEYEEETAEAGPDEFEEENESEEDYDEEEQDLTTEEYSEESSEDLPEDLSEDLPQEEAAEEYSEEENCAETPDIPQETAAQDDDTEPAVVSEPSEAEEPAGDEPEESSESTDTSSEEEEPRTFVPDPDEITAIVSCIGMENLAELHNQLIQFYGDDGKDVYQSLKSGTLTIEKKYWDKAEKFLYYCALIFRHSDVPEEELSEENISEFAQFLLGAENKRKNLNSLRYALLKHYGKEKGRRYYFMLKPYVKALNQM